MTIMPFSNCMWNAKLVAFCDENTLKTCTGTGQKKQYDMAPEVKRILTPIIPETSLYFLFKLPICLHHAVV